MMYILLFDESLIIINSHNNYNSNFHKRQKSNYQVIIFMHYIISGKINDIEDKRFNFEILKNTQNLANKFE